MPTGGEEREPWPRGRHRHGGVDRVPLPDGQTGALWLAGKRYVAPDPEAALRSIDAGTVVCLCEDFELQGHWPAYVEWLKTDPRAIWAPIHDFGVAPVAETRALTELIAARIQGGVLVHCGAGIGRAGTVGAAVLMHFGRSLEQALAEVAGARPGAGPQSGLQTDLLEQLSPPH